MRSHGSKQKYDNESTSEDEYKTSIKSENHHHHKRKHKKHRHKDDDDEHNRYRNESDDSPLRNSGEVIEIHDSGSENECPNGTNNYDRHRTVSHRNRHHDERRHKRRRKRSRSNSQSYSRERELESGRNKHKRSKGDGGRSSRNVSESDSDYQSSSDYRKRKSRDENVSEDRKAVVNKRRNEGEEKIKIKTEQEIKVERESKDRQPPRNNNSECDSNRRRNANGEPSGRGNGRNRDEEEHEWGGSGGDKTKSKKPPPGEVQKPNFGLSGKLTEDTNTFNGVVIKYSEPPEARMPKKRWRLYPFKGDQPLPPLYIHRQSAYLLGRDRKVADMPIDHPSCSKQHAALQYRLISYERPDGSVGKQIRLYIIDLESANGTFINNKKIEPRKYVELFEKDVIKFGFSSREYVLLHEHSKDDNAEPDDT